MSPQFVDFDADGKLDIVAGTYDGSPHLARGDGQGWHQPAHILDADGQRILIHEFWNNDKKKWDRTSRCDLEGQPAATGHCTSAVAFDWNGDGDHDLLLGDHRSGQIYRRDNDGTASKPAFASGNHLVHAGGAPIDVPGTVATMRVFDWNRDGLLDLLVGSMGDAFGTEPGGGVYLFLNDGSKTATGFQRPIVLVAPSKKGASAPTRPDSGIYPDAGDIDGDGDFDLVVGGYSHWTPVAPKLTDEQQARAAELRVSIGELDKEFAKLNEAAQKAMEGVVGEDEMNKKYTEAYASQKEARAAITKQRKPLAEELDKLAPGPKRISYVWLYENTSARPER